MLVTQNTPASEQLFALYDAVKKALNADRIAPIDCPESVTQLRWNILNALIETAPQPELIADMAADTTILRYSEYWSLELTRAYMQSAIDHKRRITAQDLAMAIATANGVDGCSDAFMPMAMHYWQLCGCVQVNLALRPTALRADYAVMSVAGII